MPGGCLNAGRLTRFCDSKNSAVESMTSWQVEDEGNAIRGSVEAVASERGSKSRLRHSRQSNTIKPHPMAIPMRWLPESGLNSRRDQTAIGQCDEIWE